MTATPSQAIAWAKKQTNGAKYAGLCLVFVRHCFGLPAKYPSAASAWANAKHKHHTSSTSGIPAGVPVFFSTPATRYGHVALHLGGGRFRTNYSSHKSIVTETLGHGALAGMTMLGWTEDLNGARVYTAPKTPPAAAGTYRVLPGDTLGEIAKHFGTTVDALAKLNGIKNPDVIQRGATLKIPGAATPSTYKVRKGDTLGAIAARFKTTVGRLQSHNGIKDPDVIRVGQVLKIK